MDEFDAGIARRVGVLLGFHSLRIGDHAAAYEAELRKIYIDANARGPTGLSGQNIIEQLLRTDTRFHRRAPNSEFIEDFRQMWDAWRLEQYA
jgi:hypothetical protein